MNELVQFIRSLIVTADVEQCTNCNYSRISHPNEHGQNKIGFLFKKTGCDQFEVLPMNVILPGEKIRIANFRTTQEGIQFTRDMGKYGEVEAFRLHPNARLKP